MRITTRTRDELQQYFRRNAIPTEGQFSELFAAMLNQKSDGIVKSRDTPLSIQATGVGDSASDKQVLHLYSNLENERPDWRLSLNPRSDPTTSLSDLNISDGYGNSRLFIDGNTGNIGIGTIYPTAKLDVQGSLRLSTPGFSGDSWLIFHNTSDFTADYGLRFSQNNRGITIVPGGDLLVDGDIQWGSNDATLTRDQGGSLELGGNNYRMAVGHPYIDFHFSGKTEDFNVRLINSTDGELTLYGSLNVAGKVIRLGLQENGGGQLILANNPNDNRIYLEGFSADGRRSCDELLITGIAANPLPQLTFVADKVVSTGTLGIGTVPGDTSSGLVFDGIGGYFSIPSMNPDYSNGFTVEAWVLYRSFKHWSRIIDFGNGRGIDNILFANYGTTNNLAMQVFNGSTGGGMVVAERCLDLNTWMHLAATIDSKGNVAFYRDGKRLPLAGPPAFLTTTLVPANRVRSRNYIARSNWDAPDEYFDGIIRDVRIWNVARTPNQIIDSMDRQVDGGEANLVACWPFEFNNLADLGPNKFNGTLVGGVKWQRELLIIGAGNFGSDLYVRGKIHSPLWKVTRIWDNYNGLFASTPPTPPRPATAFFDTNGGTLLIFVSGAGYTNAGARLIGVEVFLNDCSIGKVQTFTNETGSHKTFTSNSIVATPGSGTQKLVIKALADTLINPDDYLNVTVLEMPI